MVKNSIINKITPCCGLPFSVAYWWVSNLTLTTEEEREYILSKISHGGTISIDAWKTLINAGTLDPDASLSKDDFLEWFDYGRQPTCARLKIIINSFEVGSWTPETEIPANVALIDMIVNGENLSGNVYTKEQVNALITGSFGGKLMISDVPAPVGRVWYFAGESGTYVNAGNQIVNISGKMVLLIYDAGEWSQIEIAAIEGRGITSVTLSGSAADIDTYQILYSDGTSSSFQVKNGIDGKTTEQWTPKSFNAGDTVYFGGNSIWEANADTLATDVPGVSPKWVLRLTANETQEGFNLLNIIDKNGNVLGSYNKEGKLKTGFQDYSIENKALQREIGTFFEGSEITDTFDWHRVFTDKQGHIFGGIKKDGSLFWKNIDSENIVGVVRKELEKRDYEREVTKATYLTFDYPDSVVDIHVQGILPTDQSAVRTPTDVVVTFSKGGQFLFRAKGAMAIQGQGSVGAPKKGYEIDFLNAEGKTLMIKWGNMHAVDAINFKAFWTDPTMTRDISAGRLWHKVRTSRPFPSSFIADFTSSNTITNTKYQYYDDALFYADGFPMRMTHNNNAVLGLYVWRMKKKRENYRMDSGNLNNIFLDSAVNTGISLATWNPAHWDLKSPKISGYEEAGPITNPTVLASITRYYDWMSACIAGTVDMRTTYQDYLNLDSWIDYIIVCEVLFAGDSNGNNTEFMTWDGLRWSLCIYDQDNSAGHYNGDISPATGTALSANWWVKVKTVFNAELKARYTEVRNNGILSMNSIQDIYSEIPKKIPTDYYIENMALWGWSGTSKGNPSTSLRHILDFFSKRLAHLDTIYKNN